jgi:hypothetical protein
MKFTSNEAHLVTDANHESCAGTLAEALIKLLRGILEGEAPDTSKVAWALLELQHNPDLYKPANLLDQVKTAAGMNVSCHGLCSMLSCVVSSWNSTEQLVARANHTCLHAATVWLYVSGQYIVTNRSK